MRCVQHTMYTVPLMFQNGIISHLKAYVPCHKCNVVLVYIHFMAIFAISCVTHRKFLHKCYTSAGGRRVWISTIKWCLNFGCVSGWATVDASIEEAASVASSALFYQGRQSNYAACIASLSLLCWCYMRERPGKVLFILLCLMVLHTEYHKRPYGL